MQLGFDGSVANIPAWDEKPPPLALNEGEAFALDTLKDGILVRFHAATGNTAGLLRLYFSGAPASLAESVSILEYFGLQALDHRSGYCVSAAGRHVRVHEFALNNEVLGGVPESVRALVEDALKSVWNGQSEADEYCMLITSAGLSWREAALLRAYGRYLKQTGFPIICGDMAKALARNAPVTKALVDYFAAQFDPDASEQRDATVNARHAQLCELLGQVVSVEDDRILHKHLMLIRATLRTNFYQIAANGEAKPYISLKFNSQAIDDLPVPRPQFEIFVYSPRMEGIHLRGGKVARGGIRWSDRLADYRTEVHGLLKAQMVKNVVIVPEGSKGGFVVKKTPAAGNTVRDEGIECYRTLIRGLLDITDNIVGDKVMMPARVVRRDGDDPYLVVAADKGTATFSDIANALAAEYGFWLGDAFASGGSVGYDHKKMGITARGAWKSVRRHFREMGRDCQTEAFTAIGVGDMSGDVFGNGMLLSPVIRLVGAFDHRHLFLDPNPPIAASFQERQRLFALPQSSWLDYRQDAMGPGGGVYDRKAKTVVISEEARVMLGLSGTTVTPDAAIGALLRAQVDLLWLGGIGTFIKSSSETHEQVGDRANDAIRVNADQLRCLVVGEGANLGFTQRGRIQYAQGGGRINTDAIDNAGGVNCSDHEVNIKILLDRAVKAGKMTLAERNELLAEMTDEVASLVLRDNYLQTQALSVAQTCAPQMLDRHQRLIRRFERSGELERVVAGLPDDEEISARRSAGRGLNRPELSVLLAYTKISLFGEIIKSDLPDDPLFAQDLVDYFPTPLRERFAEDILLHPLRREIITTMVVNSMVNRVGSGFVDEVESQTDASDAEVARAFSVIRDVFGFSDFWAGIESLDTTVAADVLNGIHLWSQQLIKAAVVWVLRNATRPIDVSATAARYRQGVQKLLSLLPGVLDERGRSTSLSRVAELENMGVPTDLAYSAAALRELQAAFDIVLLAEMSEQPLDDVARQYFAVRHEMGISLLQEAVGSISRRDAWENQAVNSLLDGLADAQRNLVASLVTRKDAGEPGSEAYAYRRKRLDSVVAELRRDVQPTLAMLVVAVQEIAALAMEQ